MTNAEVNIQKPETPAQRRKDALENHKCNKA